MVSRRRFAVPVLLAALLLPAAAAPVAASHAPSVTGSKSVTGGWMYWHIVRGGWAVRITLTTRDTKADGHCAYAEAELIVNDGNNPDERFATACGNGESKTVQRRIEAPGIGTSFSQVDLKVCVADWFGDTCSHAMVTVPQMTAHGSAARLSAMSEIMTGSMAAFQRKKANGYGIYDWSDDGCSVPSGYPNGDTWSGRFNRACERHDWGYRNYGNFNTSSGALAGFDPTDSRRSYVDARFLIDMYRACDANPSWSNCRTHAGNFYTGVRLGGGRAFYSR